MNAFVTHRNHTVEPFTIQVTLSDLIESINTQIGATTGYTNHNILLSILKRS